MISSLKIGPVVYAVKEIDDLHSVTDDGKKQMLHGRIRYAESEIEVDSEQSEQRKVITLWHEAIHGILENAGQNDQDEQQICALGFGLVQLIRDNPQLVSLTLSASSDTIGISKSALHSLNGKG